MSGRGIWLFVLVGVLFGGAGVLSWLGTRYSADLSQASAQDLPVPQPSVDGPIVSLEMPHTEPLLPPGPNREQFHIACTTCHSTRLVLTQPKLTAAQWTASVQKMVKVYGAPVNSDQEKAIVAYLLAIQWQ